MGFLLNSSRKSNSSVEYLSDSGMYIWGGTNNAIIADSNSYTIISGAAPATENGFGSDIVIGANKLVVRSSSGNTAVYSLSTGTVVHRPNNRKAGGDVYNKQLAIIGDKIVVSNGSGTSNVYFLNNTYACTLSYNTAVIANTGGINTSGYSVDAADNRIAIGLPRDPGGGQVRVFNYNGEMLFDISSQSSTGLINYFGDVVSIGSGVIAVGVPYSDYPGSINSGLVELFDYNGYFIKALIPTTVRSNGNYGGALSVGSGIIAVAYLGQNIFDIYNTNGELLKTVTMPEAGSEIRSIKVKYGKIFVGVPSLPVFSTKGKVFIYDLRGNLLQTIYPSTLNYAKFGASIDVGYGYLAVGANNNTVSGTSNSGSVFLYKIHPAHTIEDAAYTTYNGD